MSHVKRQAKRGEPHGTGLGIFRYVVEGPIAWLHGFRRLRIRWERRDDVMVMQARRISPGSIGQQMADPPTGLPVGG
ncbi:hypothetical protein GCM10023323_66170 [Streptomyces thinghirensis]|uniref:Transposase n=1 Tax=Streptomyces thinghirensis TaxID=551547 RepID=A0ABP9TEE1_9ACTN